MKKQTQQSRQKGNQKRETKKHQVSQQMSQQMNQQMSQQSSSTKFLLLFIVVVAFAFAFTLLIKRQQQDTYYSGAKESEFNIKPEYGKTIVAKDNNAIYPKYYVVYVNNDNEYAIYVYNYYETSSQYDLEFNRLIDSIVDYNAKDRMIRYLHSRGYGAYVDVLDNLSSLVDSDNLIIY